MTMKLSACVFPAQIPNKENGFHAVCTARIVSQFGQIVSAVGEAVGQVKAPEQSTLQQAEQSAIARALERMLHHTRTDASGASEKSTARMVMHTKAKGTGGPISDKQKRLLETTAYYHGKGPDEPENIALELYGRPINELTTKEVNPILDRLRA